LSKAVHYFGEFVVVNKYMHEWPAGCQVCTTKPAQLQKAKVMQPNHGNSDSFPADLATLTSDWWRTYYRNN